MNIPNLLTLSRLVAIPVMMLLLAVRFQGHDQVAALLFVVFSLTDIVDGNLARRTGKVTDLGKFLDPLADKLFVLSILIALVQEGLVAAWLVVIIFSRELVITILRSLGAGRGRVVAATAWGKSKTVTQILAIFLLMLQRPYPVLVAPAQLAIGIAAVFTVISGLDYLWQFRFLLGWRTAGGTEARAGDAATAAEPVPPKIEGGAPSGSEPASEPDPLAVRLGALCKAAGIRVGLAESCTGGMVAEMVTAVPGSSAYFIGGLVTYSNAAKKSLLGVPAAMLERDGAVSAAVARSMAEGARARLAVDVAVSVTGIAGPDADGTAKPVGLTYIGVADSASTRVVEHRFEGDRGSNRRQAAMAALELAVEAASAALARTQGRP